jgi:hypothetical protein
MQPLLMLMNVGERLPYQLWFTVLFSRQLVDISKANQVSCKLIDSLSSDEIRYPI